MATLADIKVTLTLETTEFYKQLKQVSKQISKMGQDTGKATQNMSETFSQSFDGMNKTMGMTQREMKKMGMYTKNYSNLTEEEIGKLPDHLKKWGNAFSDTGHTIGIFARSGGKDMDAFRESVMKASRTKGPLSDVSKSGKQVAEAMQWLGDSAKEAEMAVMGLSKNGKFTLNAKQADRVLEEYLDKLNSVHNELEGLRDVDFNAYVTGMKEVEHYTARVQDTMRQSTKGGYELEKVMKRLGLVTEGMANSQAIMMERYRDSILAAHDLLMGKSTQAQGMMKMLDEVRFGGLQKAFLGIGHRLEETAKQGNAFNLALKQLGRDASMADLMKRVQDINKGIARMQALTMGAGIATGLMVYGLILLSNEIDGRLLPAFEKLKSVWSDALTPFIHAFTDFALFIMDGAIALGELAKKFAEVHPQLSQMAWGFTAITIALLLLLAPLAVCIGLAGGLSAGFALLWSMIAPLVLGFLTVLPVAMLLAAAIVSVTAVIHNMWTASENFRTAVTEGWEAIKNAVITALAPILVKWEEFKAKFMELIALFTGGEAKTMGDFWTWLGDKMAIVIDWIVANLLPYLTLAFQLFASAVTLVLDGLILAMGWFADMWSQHGDTIKLVVQWIMEKVIIAFTAIKDFIFEIAPQVQRIIEKAWNAIKLATDLFVQHVWPKIRDLMQWIWDKMKIIWPFVEDIIVDTWETVKSAIKNALDVIEGVIDTVTAIMEGDWKKAWESAKKTFTSFCKLIWDLIQLWWAGKVLKFFKAFGGKAGGALKDVAEKVKKPFSDAYTKVKDKVEEIVTKVENKFKEVPGKINTALGKVGDTIAKPFKKAWEDIKGIPGKISGAFSKMKISIPKPRLPKIEVGSKQMFGGKGGIPAVKVPTFSLKWNAKGAIFNGASILGGGQGVGEKGAEAVMPVQHKRYMRPFANAVAQQLDKVSGDKSEGNRTVNVNFNEPVIIREEADLQKLVDQIARKERNENRAKGIFSYQS